MSTPTPSSTSSCRDTRRRVPRLLVPLLALALAASACGGGDDAAAAEGVASLVSADVAADTESDTSTAAEEEVTEEDLLEWVECMRGEGIDIDDPTVDADGNLTLAPPGGGERPEPGEAGGDAAAGGGRDDAGRQEAFDVCGEPPLQRGGFEFSDEDLTALQDQALVFAQCMRDLGHDVADPTLDAGGGPGGGFGQMFAGLDRADATVQADLETCQATAFGEDGVPFGGGRGAGGPGGAGGQGQ